MNAAPCAVLLQLVQEFQVLLFMGRKLVFPVQTAAVVRADITMEVQVVGSPSGSTSKQLASLMFPGNCRTVVRLLEARQEAQVRLADRGKVAKDSLLKPVVLVCNAIDR
jgi:hypothetical protein